jgi:hypothetical protein
MVRNERRSYDGIWLRQSLVCVALLSAGARPAIAVAGSPVEHHAVSTRNPAAQRLFDEGLTLVYALNRDEATARFHKAAALDTRCAMAWWGVALAQGPNINVVMEPARNRIASDALTTPEAWKAMHHRANERTRPSACSETTSRATRATHVRCTA